MTQVGMAQVGSPQTGKPQVGTTQVGMTQVGKPQISTTQISTPQISITQVSTNQVRMTQAGTEEAGTTQIGTTQVGAEKISSSQVNPPQVSTTQFDPYRERVAISNSQVNTSKVSIPSSIAFEQFFGIHSSSPQYIYDLNSSAVDLWNSLLKPQTPFDINLVVKDLPTGQLAEAQITEFDSQGRPLKIVVHKLVPERPKRCEARVRKRRPKSYPLMMKPRQTLRQECFAANSFR